MNRNEELVSAAKKARENAHAPYSGFAVGAALLDDRGRVFQGANVENASLGLTICAERSAVAAAITGGSRAFEAVAVVADSASPVRPCGACLQVLMEFSPQMEVIMSNLKGDVDVRRLGELFPFPFNKERR
jgi:cytidine deaminase